MIWKVYDKTDTLLETIVSDIDYSNKDTITLSNNKIYNITYCDKKEKIIYIDRLISEILQYYDILTNKQFFSSINPNYIPNINEKVSFTNAIDTYKGFVEDKVIDIDEFNNITTIKLYIRINKE